MSPGENGGGPASEFLARYAQDLRALPPPRAPAISYFLSLKPEERDLWTTLLPSASAFQRESSARLSGGRGLDATSLLDETREWAIATVEEALEEES